MSALELVWALAHTPLGVLFLAFFVGLGVVGIIETLYNN